MRRAWRRWVGMLAETELGTAMALFRMAVALCVLLTVLSVPWAGAVGPVWLDVDHGGYRPLGEGSPQAALLGGATPQAVWTLVATSVGGALLLLAGVGGAVGARLVAFVTLQAFLGLADLNSHAGGSYDELIANELWLLVLAGPSRTLSVECRRVTGAWTSDRPVMRWPRLLVAFQAVLMYGTTGWQKLSAHWVPGGDLSALYYILQQPTWQLGDMRWVAWVYPLTQAATLVTWLWEVLAPLWLVALVASRPGARPGPVGRALVRWRARTVFFTLGVVFHLAVHATMNIGTFSWASLALYPAFIHPHEWRALAARLAGAGRGRTAEAPATLGG